MWIPLELLTVVGPSQSTLVMVSVGFTGYLWSILEGLLLNCHLELVTDFQSEGSVHIYLCI